MPQFVMFPDFRTSSFHGEIIEGLTLLQTKFKTKSQFMLNNGIVYGSSVYSLFKGRTYSTSYREICTT